MMISILEFIKEIRTKTINRDTKSTTQKILTSQESVLKPSQKKSEGSKSFPLIVEKILIILTVKSRRNHTKPNKMKI